MSSRLSRRGIRVSTKPVPIDISIGGGVGFLDAFIAACAMIAHSDGELAAEERRRVLYFASTEPRLTGYSRYVVLDAFAEQAANYILDPELANEMAAEKIKPMAERRREAHAIVEACRQLIPADGIVHPAELRTLDKIKRMLGFEPDDGALVWVGAPPRKPSAAAQIAA